MGVSNKVYNTLNLYRGWKTNRRIVVIESDDWGSIRMPDTETYRRLLQHGIKVDQSPYNKFDTLASIDDFSELFKVLKKHRDKNGKNPIITGNTIVANPNFEKIQESGFKEYHYELFTDTLKAYPNRSFDIWSYGINQNLFFPQLHGREHLNVYKWIHYLQNNNEDYLFAFQHKFFSIGTNQSSTNVSRVLEALQVNEFTTTKDVNGILSDGMRIFHGIFGFNSMSFIAPNYTLSEENETQLNNLGVRYIQGNVIQRDLINGNKYNFLGKTNNLGQIYLLRNVVFEPSAKKTEVNQVIKDIEKAFKNNKPAIICSHRVNFVGSLVEENRKKNLKLLDSILSKLLDDWDDIEFMTSVELGELIAKDVFY